MDTYIKAFDEQSLYAALESAGVVDFDGNEELRCTANPGYALDVIGTITRRIGGTDEQPIMETLDGYHANLRGELSQEQIALLPVIPEPRNPVRVWAS